MRKIDELKVNDLIDENIRELNKYIASRTGRHAGWTCETNYDNSTVRTNWSASGIFFACAFGLGIPAIVNPGVFRNGLLTEAKVAAAQTAVKSLVDLRSDKKDVTAKLTDMGLVMETLEANRSKLAAQYKESHSSTQQQKSSARNRFSTLFQSGLRKSYEHCCKNIRKFQDKLEGNKKSQEKVNTTGIAGIFNDQTQQTEDVPPGVAANQETAERADCSSM